MLHPALNRLFSVALALMVAAVLAATPARAHPHVWVTATGEVVFDATGAVIGIRHAWVFDEMFSAFAIQGLDADKDGKFSREELAPLAEVNVTSLEEFEFFTFARVGPARLAFGAPRDYYLTHEKDVLTLHFLLPLKEPRRVAGRVELEIYDPTLFVAFELGEGAAVTLSGAPAACRIEIKRTNAADVAASIGRLNEAFFSQLDANSEWGRRFASKVFVTCP